MERRIYLLTGIVVVFTICVNAFVIQWTSTVSEKTHILNDTWNQNSETVLYKAQLLNRLERNFGYIGFIHHFKNYVLRDDDKYYELAKINAVEIQAVFKDLAALTLSNQERDALQTLQTTLQAYLEKLEFAHNLPALAMTTAELDLTVKVDDEPAERALDTLRRGIQLEFEEAQYGQKKYMDAVQEKTEVGVWVMLPLITLAAFTNILVFLLCIRLIRERLILFNGTPDAVFYVDLDGKIIEVNQAASKLFGYSRSELVKLKIEDLVPPEYRHAHEADRQSFRGNAKMRRKNKDGFPIVGISKTGEQIPIDVAISTTNVGHKQVHVAVVRDIRKEQRLEIEAHHDHLTQVFNRRHLDTILMDEIERAKRYGRKLSVILIDLDNFKELNDEHGHLHGDSMLKTLSDFLLDSVRPSDFVGRWGGDEFLIICPETGPESALLFAHRLVTDFQMLTDLQLTLSIGLSGCDIVTELVKGNVLIEQADKALYRAKMQGRNQAQIYVEEALEDAP